MILFGTASSEDFRFRSPAFGADQSSAISIGLPAKEILFGSSFDAARPCFHPSVLRPAER